MTRNTVRWWAVALAVLLVILCAATTSATTTAPEPRDIAEVTHDTGVTALARTPGRPLVTPTRPRTADVTPAQPDAIAHPNPGRPPTFTDLGVPAEHPTPAPLEPRPPNTGERAPPTH